MTDWEAARQALLEKYGKPESVRTERAVLLCGFDPASTDADMVAFKYPSTEVARQWHQLNQEHHGHASWCIADTEEGVIGIMILKMPESARRPPQRRILADDGRGRLVLRDLDEDSFKPV